MTKKNLCVIIPTHNSLSEKNFSIFHTIRSLAWQDCDAFSITVIDDNGTDGTLELLAERFPHINIVHSDGPKNNLGYLRNLGASRAEGDLILFLDDDTLLGDRQTLSKVRQLMNSHNFCCGAERWWTSIYWHRFITRDQSTSSVMKTVRDISHLPRGINRINGFRDLNEFTFIGNFGCIQRNTWQEIGGFDEAFPGWGYEDTDLMMRLCLQDYEYCILAEHGLSVIHLTHPVDYRADFEVNMRRFGELEKIRGYYFHVNHFFGVYEADGYSAVSKI